MDPLEVLRETETMQLQQRFTCFGSVLSRTCLDDTEAAAEEDQAMEAELEDQARIEEIYSEMLMATWGRFRWTRCPPALMRSVVPAIGGAPVSAYRKQKLRQDVFRALRWSSDGCMWPPTGWGWRPLPLPLVAASARPGGSRA